MSRLEQQSVLPQIWIDPKSGSYPIAGSRGGGLGGPMTGAMRSLM